MHERSARARIESTSRRLNATAPRRRDRLLWGRASARRKRHLPVPVPVPPGTHPELLDRRSRRYQRALLLFWRMRCAWRRDHLCDGVRKVLLHRSLRASDKSRTDRGERPNCANRAAAERSILGALRSGSFTRRCWIAPCHLYEQQLWSSERALSYLHIRAIPDDLARRQRLGYAIGRTLVRHLSGLDNGRDARHRSRARAGDRTTVGQHAEEPAPRILLRSTHRPRAARRAAHLDDWPGGRGPGRRTASSETSPAPKAARGQSTSRSQEKSRCSDWSTLSASGRPTSWRGRWTGGWPQLGPADLRDLRHALSCRPAAVPVRSAGDLRRLRSGPGGPQRRRAPAPSLRQSLAADPAAKQPGPRGSRRFWAKADRIFACSSAVLARPPGSTVASKSEPVAIPPEPSPTVAVVVAEQCRADFLQALAH